ncbi:MAG: hypothetical protein K1000chlam4_00717 [Chlamydiae bacterium]|nr:hypothetical protein [Chlamydiota bacterium]
MPKKQYYLLACSLLCLFTPNLTAEEEESVAVEQEIPAQPFQPFTGRVSGNKVRLRTQPSLEAHVVREINNSEAFAIVGEESDYYAVQPSKETKGYVFRTFVLDSVVEGDRVNVRLFPDIEAPIIGRLNSGDRIDGQLSSTNNKWLEIDAPNSCHFFVAKEYVNNIGPVEMLAQMETRRVEGSHHLNAAFLYARSEMQKPFQEIDLDGINRKFETLVNDYSEFSDIVTKASQANTLIQETYGQRKVAFLETNSEAPTIQGRKLAEMGKELKQTSAEIAVIGEAAATTMGLASVNDKMLVWHPLEESLFHLWAVGNEGKSMEQFYEEEELNATVLSGILEPYSKPVKNRPGDFILRNENMPVAFLYSTKVNLEHQIGKQVTVVATPRPNNNFAFPAYYVISVE